MDKISPNTRNVKEYNGTIENGQISELAKEEANKHIETPVAHIHIAHTSIYWVNGLVMATHEREKLNPHTYNIKEHKKRETNLAITKFTHVDK